MLDCNSGDAQCLCNAEEAYLYRDINDELVGTCTREFQVSVSLQLQQQIV